MADDGDDDDIYIYIVKQDDRIESYIVKLFFIESLKLVVQIL